MLVLNEKDMRQVIDWSKIMDVVEEAYKIHSRGDYFMPDRFVVERPKDTLLYMPCFTKQAFGTKFLTLFDDNPAKGLPFIDGLMLLNDLENGKTKAILDGRYLTAVRTGAVGGVGVRHLSRKDSRAAGIVGAGQQGFYQAVFASHARDLVKIYLFDPYISSWDDYIHRLAKEIGREIEIIVAKSVEELVENSDIVITSTPSGKPVLPDDADLLKGRCIIAIGSYKHEMREIPDSIWRLLDKVYIELPFALEETGDLYFPLKQGLFVQDQVCYIGDFLQQDHTYPVAGETSFFKSVGMGLLDLCVAQRIYELALEQGRGQAIEF